MSRNVEFIQILRKMFEENPGKPTFELKEKCSDCEGQVVLAITRTSGGYGINGAALLKGKNERFLVKCTDCYSAGSCRKHHPLMTHES